MPGGYRRGSPTRACAAARSRGARSRAKSAPSAQAATSHDEAPPPWRSTLLLWAAVFAAMMVLYFIISWIPKLAIEAGLDMTKAIYAGAIYNVGAAVGIILLSVLSIRVRLQTLVPVFLVSAAALMIGVALVTFASVFRIVRPEGDATIQFLRQNQSQLFLIEHIASDLYHISAGLGSSRYRDIEQAMADARHIESSFGHWQQITERDIPSLVPDFKARLGIANRRLVTKAVKLYGGFSLLNYQFDNQRLMAEGFELPPSFPSYIGGCIRSTEGLSLLEQMMSDFK